MQTKHLHVWFLYGVFCLTCRTLAASTPPTKDQDKSLLQKLESIKDQDKPDRVQKAVTLVKNQLSQVLQNMKQAKDARDMIKLNCINEKLNALKGLLRVCEQADTTMQEFFANHNKEAAHHEFVKIMMIENKSKQLASSAASCIGEMSVYSGETQVEVIENEVSESDPTKQEITYAPVTRPPAASPYQ